jgi:DNA-binding MarR family transcriptional regulator
MKSESEKEGQIKKPSKEAIQLQHVETKKQDVGNFAKETELLKLKEMEASNTLSSIEKTILNAFQKKRMILTRIAIVVNEGRLAIHQEKIPMADLKAILDILVKKGYLTYEIVEYDGQKNDVYILTEAGEQETL